MVEKKLRGANAGIVRDKAAPPTAADAKKVGNLIEAAVQSGPSRLRRDLETWRLAHMLANDAGETASCYDAFQALAACAARAIHDVDSSRIAQGMAPLQDFAREMPGAVVQVPAWALVAVYMGWMRNSAGDVKANGQSEPSLSLGAAFGLGGDGGGRTVAESRRIFSRDVRIAISVAEVLVSGHAKSENAAIHAAAKAHNVSRGTAYSAWRVHAEAARSFVASRASDDLSESGQPPDKI